MGAGCRGRAVGSRSHDRSLGQPRTPLVHRRFRIVGDMTSLPRGTVAFLMSDIEGSTRLIGITGEFYPQLLDDHHRLMRESIDGQGGTVVSTEGDSAFAVFPSVRQAVVGAIEALRTLDAHAWPPSATVNVRIGINAGEAIFGVGGANYTGLEVHRTARIMAAGHGGQVLISESARALVGDALPHGTALRDLGPHQLRDMPAPERLHQVVAPGLREEFPPPRTLTITAPTNLPATLTRFVGRTKELDEVHALLENHRLVTLTGPGGSGARCSSPQDFSRGIAIAEKVGDLRGVAIGKSSVGWSIFYSEPKVALEAFEEGIEAARAVDFGAIEMESLMGQAWTYLLLGHSDNAVRRAAEVLELGDRVGASYITTFALMTQGIVAAERGDVVEALERYGESLRRGYGAGAHVATALGLDAFAIVALDRGDVARGTQLAAACRSPPSRGRQQHQLQGARSGGAIGASQPHGHRS